jgi:type II secretory ATPase GspE/PulE/Tfp pilus assembly ATPase PilB-like protein
VRFRIDGALHDVAVLSGDRGVRIMRHFKAISGLDVGVSYVPEQAHLTEELEDRTVEMRLAFAPSVHGLKVAVRLLDHDRIRHRLSMLGLCSEDQEIISGWLASATGSLIATGPTGSGKTTTLYAVLQELAARPCSVITIEDPVEFTIDGLTQIQIESNHGLDFASALKAMLRLDPDYLLLGEIRDAESAQTAVTAVTAGRALLTTLHTRDVVSTVTALRSYGLSDYDIAATIDVVIAQRLVRRLCTNCNRPEPVSEEMRMRLESMGLEAPKQTRVPGGCAECNDIGYRGRIGVFDIWRLNEEECQAILAHADEHGLRHQMGRRNHKLLLADVLTKVEAGITSLDEFARIAPTAIVRDGKYQC